VAETVLVLRTTARARITTRRIVGMLLMRKYGGCWDVEVSGEYVDWSIKKRSCYPKRNAEPVVIVFLVVEQCDS
jgi:hypothetical protein